MVENDLLPPLSRTLRLVVASFFDVSGIGRWATCSRTARADAAVDFVWADAYDRTQRTEGNVCEEVRDLIERPFGNAAVGWHVSVYFPEWDAFLRGRVQAYREHSNEYLVVYEEPRPDGQSEAWELEARTDRAVRENPTLASRSRIRFLEPRQDDTAGNSSSSTAPAGSSLPSPNKLLRFSTWREELRHTAAFTPNRLRSRLADHEDEVLFVTFSPCGSRLATCSRDTRTLIYTFDLSGRASRSAELKHSSAAVHAQWWLGPPFHRIAISTDGHSGRQPEAEVWDVEAGECIFRVLSPIRDVYASFVRWPSNSPTGVPVLLSSGGSQINEEYVQDLCIHHVPDDAEPLRAGALSSAPPVARLRLVGSRNYFHCLEPGGPSGGPPSRLAALTGAGPRQCDAVAIIDLAVTQPVLQGDGEPENVLLLAPRTRNLPSHAVLSVRWAQGGRLLLANTRPRRGQSSQFPVSLPGETIREALRRPAPPLGTAIELIVLDAETLDTLSIHGGHHAFTTAEAPFIVSADAWADCDIVASGGEDRCVHVWHRRHGRQLQRLEGHTDPVNAVSWCQAHRLLASASDDRTVILWGCGASGAPKCDQFQ